MSPLEEWKEPEDEGVPEDKEFPPYLDKAAIQRNVDVLNTEPDWSNLETWRNLRRHFPLIKLPPSKWSPETENYSGGWGQVLAGEIVIHNRLPDDRNIEIPEDVRREYRCTERSLHTRYDTGANLDRLFQENSPEQYKFYLSLYLNTPQKQSRGKDFLRELLQQCREKKLSITTKSFEHNYDTFIIYTWHRNQMANVLRKVYPKHADLFLSIPRVFQGEVAGISPEHIGWAQEPVKGWKGSHSGRMARVGGHLDILYPHGEPIEKEGFIDACHTAGVRPDAPWLLEFNTEKYVWSL